VLTPLSSKWPGTGFTLLVLTPVLSHLFAHVLAFEFQVGDLVVWTSLGPLPRWVPGPTTRWAPGTTRLALHGI
jgi:hypothetical protein